MYPSNESGNSFQVKIKGYVIALCKLFQARDLAARIELKEISLSDALGILSNRTGNTELLKLAKLLNKEPKAKTNDLRSEYDIVPTDPLKYSTDVEVLEAQMKGISKETYTFNKGLSLANRLKLPAYEAIYALNYKEKRPHRWKKKTSTTE